MKEIERMDVRAFKKMEEWRQDGNYEISSNFWQAFIRQNPQLREKKFVRFDSKYYDFYTVTNFL
jgi:hypothetical protein